MAYQQLFSWGLCCLRNGSKNKQSGPPAWVLQNVQHLWLGSCLVDSYLRTASTHEYYSPYELFEHWEHSQITFYVYTSIVYTLVCLQYWLPWPESRQFARHARSARALTNQWLKNISKCITWLCVRLTRK
jgi:hypothetical protein